MVGKLSSLTYILMRFPGKQFAEKLVGRTLNGRLIEILPPSNPHLYWINLPLARQTTIYFSYYLQTHVCVCIHTRARRVARRRINHSALMQQQQQQQQQPESVFMQQQDWGPNHQRWHAKCKLSWNMYTLCTHFCTLGADFVCPVGAYQQNFRIGAQEEVC